MENGIKDNGFRRREHLGISLKSAAMKEQIQEIVQNNNNGKRQKRKKMNTFFFCEFEIAETKRFCIEKNQRSHQ